MADVSRDDGTTLSRPRGSKISAMKGKGGKASRSKFSESSDKDGSIHSDENDDQVQTRKPRTFRFVSSASSDSANPVDQDASVNNEPALTRRDKVAALAARARKARGEADVEVENNAEAEPLLDAFFGGGSPGRILSRSPSLDIQAVTKTNTTTPCPRSWLQSPDPRSLRPSRGNPESRPLSSETSSATSRRIRSTHPSALQRRRRRHRPRSSLCPKKRSTLCTNRQLVSPARTEVD